MHARKTTAGLALSAVLAAGGAAAAVGVGAGSAGAQTTPPYTIPYPIAPTALTPAQQRAVTEAVRNLVFHELSSKANDSKLLAGKTVSILVPLPGPGTATVTITYKSGTTNVTFAKGTATASAASRATSGLKTARVRVKSTKSGRKTLRTKRAQHKRLKGAVRVAFKPAGGGATISSARSITLK